MGFSKLSEWAKAGVAVLAAFVLIATSVSAQSGASSVNGTVVDGQ